MNSQVSKASFWNLSWILCLSVSAIFISLACASGPEASVETETNDPELEEIIFAEKQLKRFGLKEALSKAEGSIRLTTYNIENLFDDIDDPTLTGRNEDHDETKPAHEMRAVARAIRLIDSDIVCLQEIESLEALLWFRDAYLADMGYEHVISLDAGNSRGIENAVLSRFPLHNPELWIGKELGGVHPEKYGNNRNFYAGEPVAFRRSPLKLDVELPGVGDEASTIMTLFVVHHKSGRHSQYWREAEAEMISSLAQKVEKAHEGRPVVILGDFNAQVSDKSVQIYLNNGFNDIFANSRYSGSQLITHESDRRIDLILANSAALKLFNADSAFVMSTAARPAGINWRDMDTFVGYAADHYPVSVDISIPGTVE